MTPRAKIKMLKEALRPFAKAGEVWAEASKYQFPDALIYAPVTRQNCQITSGDLVRAFAALQALEQDIAAQ